MFGECPWFFSGNLTLSYNLYIKHPTRIYKTYTWYYSFTNPNIFNEKCYAHLLRIGILTRYLLKKMSLHIKVIVAQTCLFFLLLTFNGLPLTLCNTYGYTHAHILKFSTYHHVLSSVNKKTSFNYKIISLYGRYLSTYNFK